MEPSICIMPCPCIAEYFLYSKLQLFVCDFTKQHHESLQLALLKCDSLVYYITFFLEVLYRAILIGVSTVSWQGHKICCLSKWSRPAMEPTQPLIQWVPRFFPRLKCPGCDVDHSPLSNAEVKNEWRYTSSPPICFRDMDMDIPVTFSTVSLFRVEVSASPLSLLSFSFHIFGLVVGLEIYLHAIASELCQYSKINSRGNFV